MNQIIMEESFRAAGQENTGRRSEYFNLSGKIVAAEGEEL